MSYGCNILEGMAHYVNQLNFESGERYELEMKEYRVLLLSADPKDTGEDHDQTAEPAKIKASDGTNGTTMNILNTQNIPTPNPQNILPLLPQNISSPDLQNIQAVGWIPAPLNIEPPPRISPSQPSPTLSPPTATTIEQEQEGQSTVQNLNASNLTMNQALELFELLQSRRAAEIVKPPTIEAASRSGIRTD